MATGALLGNLFLQCSGEVGNDVVLPTDGLFIGHCQLFVALQLLTQLTQLIHMSVCVCVV